MLKKIKYLGKAILILLLISVILTFFKISFLQSLRIVFGSFYVLFLPGFVITYLFFKKIDLIERIALSFALSIATVPLTMFYLNKLGMKITFLTSSLTILGIILISFIIKRILHKKQHF